MKKILLCERDLDGHRESYIKWLASISTDEMYVFAPKNVGVGSDHFILLEDGMKGRQLRCYWQWMKAIRKIVRENQIDIVHFLDGDSIMRFFGLGFDWIGAKRVIITYHHFFEGFTRRISYHMMNRMQSATSVVHTNNVQTELRKAGIKNAVVCQYPAFEFDSISKRELAECKEYYHLSQDIPVIGIVGCISRYKNIVPFLNAMKLCKEQFHLLICGSTDDVSEEEIRDAIAPYAEKTTTIIRHLSEEEYKDAIVASDIIYCIYGHEFNGASGPLTDGVCAEKMILACAHGSLGEIVRQNQLGFVASCDDETAMRNQTERALSQVKTFRYGERATAYRAGLEPSLFQKVSAEIYGKE